jgi:hypothetical protein
MKLSNLADVLRAAGLTVVESPGWADRGYAGQDLRQVRGVLWHHTATHRTRYALQDAPTLSMCLNGRPDLPGPLCNIVFGRNGTVYLLAAGVANHAGAGSAPGVPTDMGNHYLIGIEMESSGIAPWDWTPDQIRIAPHLGAALERAYLGWLDESERLQLGHLEYSSQGKIDPAGWPGGMDGLRANINTVLNGSAINPQSTTTEEDFLATLSNDEKDTLFKVLDNIHKKAAALPPESAFWSNLNGAVNNIHNKTAPLPEGQYWDDLIHAAARIDAAAAAPQIAAQINAAGIAAEVQAELVKLIGGAK